MKTLVITSFILCFSLASVAQEIRELAPAHIKVAPISLIKTNVPHEYAYIVNRNYGREFAKNPIAFMKAYFDIKDFMVSVKHKNYDSFQVIFNAENGFLNANYSKKGELTKTSQRFKNIPLPLAVRRDLYNKTKGWTMVKNTYVAYGKADRLDKERYRIKVKKDGKSKIVKIDPKTLDKERVAGI